MSKKLATFALGLWPPLVVHIVLYLSGNQIWLALAIYHLGCLVIPRQHPRDAGFKISEVRQWWLSTLSASVFVFIMIWLFGAWVGARDYVTSEAMLPLRRTEPWNLFVVYIISVNPVLEEYYWRGFFQRRTGITIGTLFFAFMHWPLYTSYAGPFYGLLWCWAPTLGGLFWGWLREYYDTIWPSVITHIAVNGAMLLVASELRMLV